MKLSRLACCFGPLLVASMCFAQIYNVTNLGIDVSGSNAVAINAYGQVTGSFSQTVNGVTNFAAFRTAPDVPIAPDADTIYGIAWPYAINDSGQVVGMLWDGSDFFAFSTDPNGHVPIVIGQGGTFSTSINNSGQTVVVLYMGDYVQSFRTTPNGYMGDDLGTLAPAGLGSTYAVDINDSGQVVGNATMDAYWNIGSPNHAFRTAPNSPINRLTDDLGTLGGSASAAKAINAFGQVVGWSDMPGDSDTHAFRTVSNSRIIPATDDLGPGMQSQSMTTAKWSGHLLSSIATGSDWILIT